LKRRLTAKCPGAGLDFRGDSAAASLKPDFFRLLLHLVNDFRGDSAAASLKRQVSVARPR